MYGFLVNAGIHLLELEPASAEQKGLPLDESPHGQDELMNAMDRINARYGHGSLYLASAGTRAHGASGRCDAA